MMSNENTSNYRLCCFSNSQESEIVEVLWKQDVDLGYTLAPPVKTDSTGDSTNNPSVSNINAEENEKLKVLQDLKNEKVSLIL